MHLPLSCGKTLSVHRNLRLEYRLGQDGRADLCLLGLAYQSDPDRGRPFEEASRVTDAGMIPRVIESWSGTWLLIWRDVLYMDACGLIGCFFTEGGIISGSLHCINQVLARPDRDPRLTHQFGLDYYPGPLTVYPDTERLMPSRHLMISACRPVRHELFARRPDAAVSDGERTRQVIDCFLTILKNFRAEYEGRIYLALTGGYDSRVTMAMLELAGIDYTPFTLEYEGMSDADREIPAKLAALAGREYLFSERHAKADPDRRRQYDTHCALMSREEDREFLAYHQYPEDAGRHAILRSGVWGVVLYSFPYVERCGLEIEKYAGHLVNVRGRRDIRASLEEWLRQVRDEADPECMELISRFYWEQRAGCWLSDAEQALSVMENADSLQLLNCSRLLSLLYGYDRKMRETKQHEIMLIGQACPGLLKIPFDPHSSKPKTKPEKIKRDASYIRKCIRCLDRDAARKECRKWTRRLVKDVIS